MTMALQWPACLAILALAAFAQGVFGLGFAMIATPLLALFLPYRASMFMAAGPLLVLALYWLGTNRAALRSSNVPLSLVPGVALGATAGVWVQLSLPERASLSLMAGMLAFSIAVPWVLHSRRRDLSQSARRAAPAFGVLAGMTESALNVGAPLMVLFGGLTRLSRLEQLIALNLCFCIGKLVQLGLFLAAASPPVPLVAMLAGGVVSLLSYRAGDRLAGRFPEDKFKRCFSAFLLLIVAALVVRVMSMD